MFLRSMFIQRMFIQPMFIQHMFIQPMLHKALRLPCVLAHRVYLRRKSALSISAPLVAIAMLATPGAMLAQRGGGRSQPGATTKPVICVHDCIDPHSGLGSDDDRNLERLMAVQATPEQTTSFNNLLQDVQAARDRLQTFTGLSLKPQASPDPAATLNHAVEKARSDSQNFLASFSPVQKSGLKDATKKVESADADLDKQRAAFDRAFQTLKADSAPIAAAAANLDNALASFQTGHLALGREMSIVLPSDGEDLAFILPAVKSAIDLAGRSISIPVSGAAARVASADGRDQFSLRVVADFSDLQLNVTGLLRSLLTRSPRCGERLEVQHASLNPLAPASLVVVRLHFERWICPGGGSPMELASGEATVEVKLTPSVERNSATSTPTLHLASEFGRVDAEGLLRESLLSGTLGDTVRDQIAAMLLPAMQKAADLKAALPPVAPESATIQKVQFQDAGAGQLRLVLEGQLQLSDEQAKQFAVQLKRPISAQQTSPQ